MSRGPRERARANARGRLAESLCAWLLRLKAYRILATGYRTKVGEIDVLAARGDTLVAVEVKVRANRATALEAVTWRQRRRIERALAWYLRGHPECAGMALRFDVFAVVPWRLPSHIENAWRANE